jgi:hypothetical protein
MTGAQAGALRYAVPRVNAGFHLISLSFPLSAKRRQNVWQAYGSLYGKGWIHARIRSAR